MRLLALAIFVAATCRSADPPGTPAPHRTAPAATSSAAPGPLVFAPLAWDLPEDDNLARLATANMAPHADEQRGYFTDPDQGHAGPGTIGVSHTVEPVLIFTPRPGWHGVAHYATVGGALDRIEISARVPGDEAFEALAELERVHGPPTDRREIFSGEAVIPPSLRLIWVRDGVWLVAFAAHDGQLAIHYRRDDRPASAIGP